MSAVILRKKGTQTITEDTSAGEININITDENIKQQIISLKDRIDKATQRYNTEVAGIKTQIDLLMKKDAELAKQNQQNNNSVNNTDASAQVTESFDYIYRKACRLSKRLYESAKSKKADLSVELIDLLGEMELSYTLNQDECDRLARKIIDVLDNKLSSKADKNQWPDVVSEIKKYFKNNSISLSSSEKTKVCDAIKDCVSKMPEYDWIFGGENENLSDRIKDSLTAEDKDTDGDDVLDERF